MDIQPNFPAVVADEDQCKQVFLDLINNAIDAVEDGAAPKRISVRIFQRGGRAVIVIADTGPGFSDLNRAFDPFSRRNQWVEAWTRSEHLPRNR